jgi:hypothetical protein
MATDDLARGDYKAAVSDVTLGFLFRWMGNAHSPGSRGTGVLDDIAEEAAEKSDDAFRAAEELAKGVEAARVPFRGFQEWGRALWGRNVQGAKEAIEKLTPELARRIDPAKARQALEFYKQAAASGRGGETALARVRLMEQILELQK